MSKLEREALKRVVESSRRIVQRRVLTPDPLEEIAAAQADSEDIARGRGSDSRTA